MSLSKSELQRGLITAYSGNHGIAVAYAAKIAGSRVIVVVPQNAVKEKVESIKNYVAEVIDYGRDYDEAYLRALEIKENTGTTFVHPFDEPLIIAGQGTIGLELISDVSGLSAILVPIGGGGLLSGVSIAAKSLNPHVRIIGVQSRGAPAVYNSWKAGTIMELDSTSTVADGLAARKPSDLTFEIMGKNVDDILLVSDQEIGEAMIRLLQDAHILAEPSGAASLAAFLFKYKPKPEEKVALVISGANISMGYLASLLKEV